MFVVKWVEIETCIPLGAKNNDSKAIFARQTLIYIYYRKLHQTGSWKNELAQSRQLNTISAMSPDDKISFDKLIDLGYAST
jgi:hypothetical protein